LKYKYNFEYLETARRTRVSIRKFMQALKNCAPRAGLNVHRAAIA
jgi:hypothetical protein